MCREIQRHVPLDEEDPWMDMIFDLTDVDVMQDRIGLRCRAKAKGKQVELCVSLPRFWLGRNKDGSPQSYSEDCVVFSTTPESAELYSWMATWPEPEKPYEEAWAEGWDPTWNHKKGQI